jgi:iron complex outermembrane receptor protein
MQIKCASWITRAYPLVLLSISLSGSGAYAQDSGPAGDAEVAEEGSVMEEVIVTAMRREQLPQEISASLGVVTNAEIMRLGLDDFQGYSRSQPGVTMHQTVKNRSTFNIRGINTDIGDTQLTQEPVAVYINDMPVTQPYAALVQVDLRLYDIDRIEILRGPQGTLFGSGTLGGLVRVLTRQPVLNEFEASVRVDWADVKHAGFRQRYDAMVNVPLGEDVALRAVAYARDEPGWVKNVVLGTENSSDDWGGRLALLWEPTDRFSAKLEYLHQDSQPEDGDAWNPDLGQFKRDTVIAEGRKAVFSQTNLTLTYDFPDFATLTSSTNFQETDSNWLLQTGEIPGIGPLLNLSEPWDTEYFAQEFRLVSNSGGPFSWVAGLFYLESKTEDAPFRLVVDGLQDFVEAVAGPGIIESDVLISELNSSKTEELAAYGDLTWYFAEKWSLSGGLRVFKFDSSYAATERYAFDFGSFGPVYPPDVMNQADDSSYTWRTVLSYQATDDKLFYGGISKGYRVGQVNPNFGPSFVDPEDLFIQEAYDSDESINYELGAKTLWLDGRLQVNAALYFIDWTDVQVDAVRPSDRRNFIANAGNVHSKGFELELVAVPIDNLDLRWVMSWQDSEVNEISPVDSFLSGALEGDTMPGTADFLTAASVRYLWDLSGSWDLEGYVGVQYVDDSPNRFSYGTATGLPNPDFAINESYTNIDAGLSLLTDQWAATLYVENLGDNDNIILDTGAVALGSGDNRYITLRPRTIGVRVNYRF